MTPYTEKNLARDIADLARDIAAVIKELRQIRKELANARKAVLLALDASDPGDGFPENETEEDEE